MSEPNHVYLSEIDRVTLATALKLFADNVSEIEAETEAKFRTKSIALMSVINIIHQFDLENEIEDILQTVEKFKH